MRWCLFLSTSLSLLSAGCTSSPRSAPIASPSASVPAASAPVPRLALPVREGGVIARAPTDDALYVADEDHRALRVLALPLDVARTSAIDLPGAPAQVLPTSTSVLVTIRDPGMLVIFAREGGALVEKGRVPLATDAWGVALTPDERRAIVTSAWTHTISVVDLETRAVVAKLDVRREPRGVLVEADGKSAWVTHLVGSSLTRIEGVDGVAPTVREIALPPSPLRAPLGKVLSASLGYALVASPDGKRLYAPRHALGALGVRNWYGAPTVDVLELPSLRSPVPPRRSGQYNAGTPDGILAGHLRSHGQIPFVAPGPMVQPRAIVYRKRTNTLLVAAEGTDSLVELDARSPDPALKTQLGHELGGRGNVPYAVNESCAAPAGLALSADENKAYVFCRASYDVVAYDLATRSLSAFRLATDPLGAKGEKGRRMFYGVGDVGTSGGLGCAGCHPDGRDDGHTWHEVVSPETLERVFVAEQHALGLGELEPSGFPRQTQMLAGRVDAIGPYGWHAQAPTLEARAQEGFLLHRWDGQTTADRDTPTSRMRAQALALFLRQGLVPPPVLSRALTEEEERGKKLFDGGGTRCADCHVPRSGYTDRVAQPLRALPTRATFADEEDLAFKTPSLAFVGGTAPYYHDGSAPTLEALVELNHDRMGKTSHLSREDRAALVAFLRTL